MQNRWFHCTLLALFLSIAGCSTTTMQNTPAINTIHGNPQPIALMPHTYWNLQGMIAIQTAKQSLSANLRWVQQGENYSILLFGPLGTGATKLTGKRGYVQLQTAQGQIFTANSPEEILLKQVGWNLPISNLYYWMRGFPVPNSPAQTNFDVYHRPIFLQQQGWTIQYLRFDDYGRPNKIILTYPQEILIKIVLH